MTTRGIRGAITIESDTMENVLSSTRKLLDAILASNPDLKPTDIASVIFTVTEDITSAYPALAARQMGWDHVPMICAREIPVDGSLPHCIRTLINWNTDRDQTDIQHEYLLKASVLRPDLTGLSGK